jgi:hypothetical protein
MAPQVIPTAAGWQVKVDVQFIAARACSGYMIASVVDKKVTSEFSLVPGVNHVSMTIVMTGGLQLWWPQGMGSQTLYALRVDVVSLSTNTTITVVRIWKAFWRCWI